MRFRALFALVLALAGWSLLSAPAPAAAAPGDREVRRIIRDCSRDDDLDRRYSVKALRRALRRLPSDVRNYTGCPRAIRRAIRRQVRLNQQVRRIFRDCSPDGDLDRRYRRPALRAALRRIETTGRHRDCRRVIRQAVRNPGQRIAG
jgi:hypothetical protein